MRSIEATDIPRLSRNLANWTSIDPFRNGSVQTVVSPYSVRRKPHAPVSTPLAWKEVTPVLDPGDFNLGNFGSRQKAKDPWDRFFATRQNLKEAERKLRQL